MIQAYGHTVGSISSRKCGLEQGILTPQNGAANNTKIGKTHCNPLYRYDLALSNPCTILLLTKLEYTTSNNLFYTDT